MPVFEGPLDLLLQLIEREELDITALSLAQVTDQYLAIVEQMGPSLADLTAFLVVAAKLLLIKSRVLLPGYRSQNREEDEVARDLIGQLETYRAYRVLAGELARLEERGWRAYVRVPRSDDARPAADPSAVLSGVTLEELRQAALEALRTRPLPTVGHLITPPRVTVVEQMAWIQERLIGTDRLCFQDLLEAAMGRAEIVITFLAVLELIKQERIQVWQEELFGPIFIRRHEPNHPDQQH